MKRRKFLTLVGGATTWPVAAGAQTPGRVYRIGYLAAVSRRLSTALILLDELRLAGSIEGQNLAVLEEGFDVKDNDFAGAAAALVKAAQ